MRRSTDQGPNDGTVMFSTAKSSEEMSGLHFNIITELAPDDLLVQNLIRSLEKLSTLRACVTSLRDAVIEATNYVLLELDRPFISDIDEHRLSQLQSLLAKSKGVLWVVKGGSHSCDNPEGYMSSGLARSIRLEMTGIKLVNLNLARRPELSSTETAETIVRLLELAFSPSKLNEDKEMEYAEEDGIINIPRLLNDEEKDKFIIRQTGTPEPEIQSFFKADKNLKLKCRTPGLLDSLCFVETDPSSIPIGDMEVKIDIRATGINFKDVMMSLGHISYRDLGQECSGIITAVGGKISDLALGDRVCAITRGSFATSVRTPHHVVAKIPSEMDFNLGASIPVVFCTAYYALINAGRLAYGESVLIHAAAGGVGQAAIMLSKYIGADIYVTVSSREEKEFLKSKYNIEDHKIFSSRDVTFEEGMMRATNGKGVDVVLNSVAGEALIRTLNCLKPLGRFIEIGKRDLELNTRLDMNPFLKALSFIAVDLEILITHSPELILKLLSNVMALIRDGSIQPVAPVTTYSMSDVEEGFRQMQTGKHMGKIVIEAQSDDQVKVRYQDVAKRFFSH